MEEMLKTWWLLVDEGDEEVFAKYGHIQSRYPKVERFERRNAK